MAVNAVNSDYSYPDSTIRETSSSLDKDAFLKLFIEQLKNQDPMNPQDSSEFMSQMAQFSMLEQLTNINEGITEGMSQLILSQEMTEASGLLGKQVSVEATDGSVSGLVEKITIDESGIKLLINGNSYDLESVTEISQGE